MSLRSSSPVSSPFRSVLARRVVVAASIAALASANVGCSTSTPPPPRVPVPMSPDDGAPARTYPKLRPLRGQAPAGQMIPPPVFEDAPIVTQAVPEEPAYVTAYNRVGKPRIAVFVDRTIDGQMPSETQAREVDFQAFELSLTEALSAGGKVTIESPTMTRQRLSENEVNDLQSGRPQRTRAITDKLDADVLVQVQARPTKQTADGTGVEILVEAINTRGSESLARAFVDVPPPMDKTQINKFTRFLARKVMVGMANAWNTMAEEPPPATRVNEGPGMSGPSRPEPAPEPAPTPAPLAPPPAPPSVPASTQPH